ncbi:GNAT family N-acetyltransferase [Microvirga tunisiensis]|uniref:GNAT family N-acetyltransferase n=2 Tax=Pannonibacter tanglangensis TaxID=2750084 RepID=A0ABW9ZIH4_9HYPH|nr:MULTISPECIES: N-acetyltransferase [unclassified Pannonibacter]NBN64647.1 GNAT family N-acetyltransferase [Pannonibacter sp. XCT-34]NBN79182.1 GNAT family N-acetyltransferase [Pannonibacter sp. XCT-53]
MSDLSNTPTVSIRPVVAGDEPAVAAVIRAAFGQDTEARLVHNLRHCGALELERLAETADGRIVGHVAFSRVTGAGAGHRLQIVCMAPVSVVPDLQRMGVGSALITAALADLRARGEDLVLVLGPPAYFPRFGFDAGLARQVQAPYAGAAFMALALTEAGRRDLPVEVSFATPFEEFE